MADNVAITAGSGTTIAADDIGGVLHQRVKISQGADGSGTDVSSAAPLQVSLANTAANTNKLLVTPDLPSGASTAAKQPALGTAGSSSTDVISVQGIAAGTALPASQSGTWTVQPGNTANTTAWKVDGSAVTQPISGNAGILPLTSGGLSISSAIMASGTNATSVKASAGQLYSAQVTNNSANIGYLKFYNTAGTPTAGSGTPVLRIMVPGNSSGSGIVFQAVTGIAFGTGIGYTFTGAIADNDTTSVAANAFIVNLEYK